MRFLIIDDDSLIRVALKKAVQSKYPDAKFVECEDGMSGMEIYDNDSAFDAIFVDYVMPKADGLKVVRHIRKTRKDRKIPLLMVTSRHDRKTVMTMIGEGVSDFIKKPFQKDMLTARLSRAISVKAAKPADKEESPGKSVRHANVGSDVIDDTAQVVYLEFGGEGMDDSGAMDISENDMLL